MKILREEQFGYSNSQNERLLIRYAEKYGAISDSVSTGPLYILPDGKFLII